MATVLEAPAKSTVPLPPTPFTKNHPPTDYTLQVSGVPAVCDAWALDRSNNRLTMFSVVAPPATIKTLRGLMSPQLHVNASIQHEGPLPADVKDDNLQNLIMPTLGQVEIFSRRVRSLHRQQHMVVMMAPPDRELDPDKEILLHLFTSKKGNEPQLLHRTLTTSTPILTVPQWAQQVWEICRDNQWITPMSSYGIHGWTFRFNANELQEAISTQVADGKLRIVIDAL